MIDYESLMERAKSKKVGSSCFAILLHIWAIGQHEGKYPIQISINKVLKYYLRVSPHTLCKKLSYFERKSILICSQKPNVFDFDAITEVRFL